MSSISNLGQIMPYFFCSTGSLPGTTANILSAPALMLNGFLVPDSDQANAIYVNLEWKDGRRAFGQSTLDEAKNAMPMAWDALHGNDAQMRLWAAKIWSTRCEFYLFDHTGRQAKQSNRSNVIKIENCCNLSLSLSADAFRDQPARSLLCRYNHEQPGGYVEFNERVTGSGEFKFIAWPNQNQA